MRNRQKKRRKRKKFIDKIIIHMRLRAMDEQWNSMDQSGWSLFPPSFYYTHTKAEVERITSDTLSRLRKLIDELL